MPAWNFLTNHARVLLCIAHDPGLRLRDIAARVGIMPTPTDSTSRTAHLLAFMKEPPCSPR
jgi:hypothetical protein